MNLLKFETSPYLLQHKDNPVSWRPWGPEALGAAKAANKPILLSIGYAACHWCHVMAHESFEDAGTADLMNEHFINVKVDREERPDVDAVFQNALALMGRQGGWPLTIFLTPDGTPFWGGTYFPPQPKQGLPGFREILRGLSNGWVAEQDKISHNADALRAALEKLQENHQGHVLTTVQAEKIGAAFLELIDPVHGGLRHVPKFPNLPIFALLWDFYVRAGSDAFKSAVIHGLTQMCQGGIYDHVGGGFARYSTDAEWLAPHFEKMLYDNAQFIALLTEVWKETQNPLLGQKLHETIAFLADDLAITEDGQAAFASSLDADSLNDQNHPAEGAFYTWTTSEIDAVLAGEAAGFKETYDITAFGNWEDVNIPNRLKTPAWLGDAREEAFAVVRAKLKIHRAKRPAPARDDKILADWNGLAIAALARAGFALDEPRYVEMAKSAFTFIMRRMAKPDGRLYHSFCAGKAAHPATLEDYANMADGALALYETSGDADFLEAAEKFADILNADYRDPKGGFFMTDKPHGLPLRPKSVDDAAVPSGNGTAIAVFARLYRLTGKKQYLDIAEDTARAFSGHMDSLFFSRATLLRAMFFLTEPLSVVVTAGEGRAELVSVLRRLSLPQAVLLQAEDMAGLPQTHPAYGKTPKSGRAEAFVCRAQSCLAPVIDAEALQKLLRDERKSRNRGAANDK